MTEKMQTLRRSHGKVEAEIEVMQPRAKEHLAPPEAGKGKERSSLEPLWGAQPCQHLGLAFQTETE